MDELIFNYNDRRALQNQCDATCEKLYQDFLSVLLKSKDDAVIPKRICQLRDKFHCHHWLARYASVVLFSPISVTASSITLVGLDRWERKVHASLDGRENTAIADVTHPAEFNLGTVSRDGIEDLLQQFDVELRESEHNTGSARRQSNRHEGNQKTPAFASHLLKKILRGSQGQGPLPIQGGTTDVGLHTGCNPRDTTFPLVLSVVRTMCRHNGELDDELFKKCILSYFLAHLKGIVSSIDSFSLRRVDRVITVIREIEGWMEKVVDVKFKERILEQCQIQDARLKEKVATEIDKKKVHIALQSVSDLCDHLQHPPFPVLPDISQKVCLETQLKRAREDSRKNLNWTDLSSPSFNGTLKDVWVKLHQLNVFFWELASQLDDPMISHNISELRTKLRCHEEATNVARVAAAKIPEIMSVELLSCKCLAIWVSFCCAHRTAEDHHPLFRKYSPALDPADLIHLVLKDKRAIDAVKNIRTFLASRGGRGSAPFQNDKDTLALALEFGLSSNRLIGFHESELLHAENRITVRYAEIRAKQEALARLDPLLATAERDHAAAVRATKNAVRATKNAVRYTIYGDKDGNDFGYVAAQKQQGRCCNEVSRLKSLIAYEQIIVSDLYLALPRTKNISLQWLFFLYMPQEFRDVSALAHLGKSQLWQTQVPSTKAGAEDLRSWFTSHKIASPSIEPSDMILLHSLNPRQPMPSIHNIRHYARETGILFPDALLPIPRWNLTDPFSIGRQAVDTVKLYTEMLPKAHRSEYMQQFMPMLPSSTRGNEGIAQKGKKPDWLSSEAYCKFVTMRAYPNMQIRELVTALVDDTLPFEHRCVCVLVKQMLFHIGENDWKIELTKGWHGLERLAEQMGRQVEILARSPKDSGKLVLFGVISSFLGQYDQANMDCAIRFASIARSWASDLEGNIDSSTPPEVYWKQAKFYASALLCHSTGEREGEDYLAMAELIVLFKHKTLFASQNVQTRHLKQVVASVMASRIEGIIETVQSNSNHLTACVALVIDGLPLNLAWRKVSYSDVQESGCFEALSETSGQLYSVNLLTGTLLVDGIPPGFLPLSVVDDPLYTRTFGSKNFEAVVLGSQHYATAKGVNGGILFYEFLHDAGGQLHILECSSRPDPIQDGGSKLLLLRKDLLFLPRLLREEHSHWYSTKHDCVALRGPSYKETTIKYLVTREDTFEIPLDLQNCSLEVIKGRLFACDRLVVGQTGVIAILKRFESSDFIHMSVNPSRTSLRYSLPRLKLTFDQTDHAISSKEFACFNMRTCQILEGTLYGVDSYIVLERSDGYQKVLVPSGEISPGGKVEILNNWQAHCGYYTYDVHRRFGNLIATNREGRLHLAGLYTSSSSYMAEPRLSKTGTTVATELVRQCWTNEPLSAREQKKLIEVSKLSYLSCTLRLMCSWIWQSSNSIRFLHTMEPQPSVESLDLEFLAFDEYVQNPYTPSLLPYEELLLLGTVQPHSTSVPLEGYKELPMAYYDHVLKPERSFRDEYTRKKKKTSHSKLGRLLSVARKGSLLQRKTRDCNHPEDKMAYYDHVLKTERSFRDEYIRKKKKTATMAFPLKKNGLVNGLEEQVYDDLIQSWEGYCQLPEKVACFDEERVTAILQTTRVLLQQSEKELFHSLCHGDESVEYRLSQISGKLALATQLDFLCMAWDDRRMTAVNPFLGSKTCMETRLKIVEWMMLCVLEDKLVRILSFGNLNEHALIGEFECVREWNPFEHPKWLAFEVEQQMQIRPCQYSIVRQLLEKPGSCTQLNMGLGKTRVMLPMLVLELSQSKETTVRVTALSAIIHEAMEHMQTVLVASVQNVRVCSLPFNRENPLDEEHAAILTEELARCRDHLGCLIVTPQHRNSLLLKQYDNDVFVHGLKCRFSDVVDETDAILDHEFQLVYAIGEQAPLPDGPCRWGMVEAFLQIIARGVGEEEVDRILRDPSCVHKESSRFVTFSKLRLLAPFKEFEAVVGPALCRRLIANPPYELRWMKEVPLDDRDRLVSMLSQRDFRDVVSIIQSNQLLCQFEGDILAARGCIAHGTLFHGLYRRYRVHYGIDNTGGRKMAVPYAASDTPKARAEYSHPDMAIIYTCLSYYHEGLELAQFKDALVRLQTLGWTAQEVFYGDWVSSVRQDADPAEFSTFDDVLKVDVDNLVQLSLMHLYLYRSMEVVSFWMNNFVFPDSTYQFPSRRVTSAWNLVDSGEAIGFSGTDDIRFLLPLHIKQVPPSDPTLRSTNGEMIDRVIQCTERILLLGDGDDQQGPLWKGVIKQCISLSVSALIDVAGLMAGSANDQVAEFMAGELSDTRSDTRLRGIVYFNVHLNSWFVYELENFRHFSLKESSLTEAECFAYFDQSRCRGADLKLDSKARALVTLEPKLRKDRFLQGCMRMRNLRKGGQSLILAGTAEYVSRGMATTQILEKTLHNSVTMVKEGVVTLLERGMHFYSFPSEVKEDVTLGHMYGRNITDYEDLRAYLDSSHVADSSSSAVNELVHYCKEIGQGVQTKASRLAEECEQEMEMEEEEEEEEEKELPLEKAYTEIDWEYGKAFTSPESLLESCFFPLTCFVSGLAKEIAGVRWSEMLYCTRNFWCTIQSAGGTSCTNLANYLRPVNSVLCMPSGKVILVSEYEAHKLLPYWIKATSPKATFHHLCMINFGKGFGREDQFIGQEALTSAKLFRGYVQFTEGQREILSVLFEKGHVRTAIQNLLAVRDRTRYFDRSDLDGFSLRLLTNDSCVIP
jgi:hypothetical protein